MAGSSSMKKIKGQFSRSVSQQEQVIKRIKDNGRIKWDYLVLQSWKDVVADEDAGYAEYAQKWTKMVEEEGIKVEAEETEERLKLLAAQYQMPLGKLKAEMEKNDAFSRLKTEIRNEKTMAFLLEHAKIKK